MCTAVRLNKYAYIGMNKTKVLNEVYFRSSNGKIEVFVNNKNRRIYRDSSEAVI